VKPAAISKKNVVTIPQDLPEIPSIVQVNQALSGTSHWSAPAFECLQTTW
jgi:hypothetical protein